MGKRGIKPQPKALAIAKELYRPSRHDNDIDNSMALEFVNRENLPMPPEHFDKELQEVWTNELFEIGKVYGWVGFVDLPMFEQWCICYMECRKLKELCDVSERMTITKNKGAIMNPIFKELREAQKLLTKISAEFGLTPSSRTGIKLEQINEPDKEEVEYKI
jgi:P27 family predicted phage terminase small subunit